MTSGEVAEWLNALVLKTSKGLRPSGVRIPPSPPDFYDFTDGTKTNEGDERLSSAVELSRIEQTV